MIVYKNSSNLQHTNNNPIFVPNTVSNQLTGLGENVWVSDYFKGAFQSKQIADLNFDIRYNIGGWCRYGVTGRKDCLSVYDVDTILAVYNASVQKGEIPEYDLKRVADYKAIESKVDNYIRTSGITYSANKVHLTLYEGYYKTLRGELDPAIMFPITYKKRTDLLTLYKAESVPFKITDVPIVGSLVKTVDNVAQTAENTAGAVKWVIPTVIVGVGGILLFTLYNIGKQAKPSDINARKMLV